MKTTKKYYVKKVEEVINSCPLDISFLQDDILRILRSKDRREKPLTPRQEAIAAHRQRMSERGRRYTSSHWK